MLVVILFLYNPIPTSLYIIIATPTAPPTTAKTSTPHPILVATPVCNPGLPVAVELPETDPTPAVPLGAVVSAALPATTVTAVTVL